MKKLYFLIFAILISGASFGQTVFINEIHYDDASGDSGEGVEIAGPAGTNLSGYTLTPYNGNGGASYAPIVALSGIIPDEGGSGYGTLFFAVTGLQNGAPDGIALDNGGSLIQFLSYEGSFVGSGGVANGVTSTDIGVSESGTVEGESLQLTGNGFTYGNFAWSSSMAATPGLINTSQTFGTPTPSLALSDAPASGGSITVGPEDLSGDLEFVVTNFVVGEPGTGTEGDGYIGWQISNVTDGGIHDNGLIYDISTPTPFATLLPDKEYLLSAVLYDNSGVIIGNPEAGYNLQAFTLGYNTVTDLAGVRAGTEGLYYEVTGEVIITYIVTENSRNQKYVQDNSLNPAGILIDDPDGIQTTVFNMQDGITGLKGQLSSFNGVLQLVPTVNIASASSNGNITNIEDVTAADLFSNGENYESELIRIDNITFTDAGGTFSDNTNYEIVDGGTTTICRVAFGDENLIGATIPTGTSSIIGLGSEFNGTYQIQPRFLSDVENASLSSEDLTVELFKIYPNPTSLGYVKITSKSQTAMNVNVFDILGKQVINQTVTNNRLEVSNLTTGIYIMKISQDDTTTTKKLVIK